MVVFFYRGTPITRWDMTSDIITSAAGEYQTSVSTRNNQKKNEKAIAEYKRRGIHDGKGN